jgi:phosphoglycolate phosphatase
MKKKCIIFDMDGTLVDSSKGITKSVNYVREHLGFEPIQMDELVRYINDPNEHLPLRFYGTPEYDPAHKALFGEHYLKHCTHELKMYEDIDKMLHSCSPKAHLGVATNAWDHFAKKMLDYCGVGNYFDAIVGANTYGVSKPDPLMLYKLLESLHVKPESAVLVGDSLKDAYAAKRANMPFVYVTWGYGNYEPETPYVANTSKELSDILDDLINH